MRRSNVANTCTPHSLRKTIYFTHERESWPNYRRLTFSDREMFVRRTKYTSQPRYIITRYQYVINVVERVYVCTQTFHRHFVHHRRGVSIRCSDGRDWRHSVKCRSARRVRHKRCARSSGPRGDLGPDPRPRRRRNSRVGHQLEKRSWISVPSFAVTLSREMDRDNTFRIFFFPGRLDRGTFVTAVFC